MRLSKWVAFFDYDKMKKWQDWCSVQLLYGYQQFQYFLG